MWRPFLTGTPLTAPCAVTSSTLVRQPRCDCVKNGHRPHTSSHVRSLPAEYDSRAGMLSAIQNLANFRASADLSLSRDDGPAQSTLRSLSSRLLLIGSPARTLWRSDPTHVAHRSKSGPLRRVTIDPKPHMWPASQLRFGDSPTDTKESQWPSTST